MELTVGQIVGEYRIRRLLGRGGMGAVYEAEDAAGNRCALKMFSSVAKNRNFLAKRFRVEAKLLAGLDHPRLVKVHDVGEFDGAPFFTMDLVLDAEGEPTTLESARCRGGVPQEQALRWFRDLADVLAYLHANGIVHRDVKLENVLVDAGGHAVLSDFGVSRIVSEELRQELEVTKTFIEGQTTGTRPVMGTYFYLAPEVRAGQPVTPASDWYALGVLFFRFLTGMWYEPQSTSTSASPFDLLLPFDAFWQTNLPRLLSDDPARRFLALPEARTPAARHRAPFVWALASAVAVLTAASLWFFLRTGTAVSTPSGVLYVGDDSDWAEAQRPDVTSLVVRGSIRHIPNNICEYRANLRRVMMEEGVKRIGDTAFFGCSNLVSVSLPDSCTHIRGYAFGNCVSLREVHCGKGLESVGRAAFGGCSRLTDVYFKGTAPQTTGPRVYVRTPESLVNHVPPDAPGWTDRWPPYDESARRVKHSPSTHSH